MTDTQSKTTQKRQRSYQNADCMEKLKKLYLDSETADVRFSFGSTDGDDDDTAAEVPAHKSLLAGTSDVFKAMFYGDLKETGNIHVPDTYEAAFKEFLQYFYMSKVKLSADHVEAVLHLGNKYDVEKCVNDCFAFLIDSLDDDNVCNHLRLAILYEHSKLMLACEKRLQFHAASVLKSAGFLACDRYVLEHILTAGLISCPENEVFEACMSWVKAKSKQNDLTKELVEQHLGDLLYEIRFGAMKIDKFCVLANQYDSVLSSYHKTITNMIVLNKGSDRFKTTPRNAKWNSAASIKCDRVSYNDAMDDYELNKIDKTIFSSNKSLLLEGFTCSTVYGSDLKVDVKIYEYRDFDCQIGSGNLLLEMKANLKSENVQVSLPHPVIVKPRLFYVIRIGPFAERYYCYSTESKYRVKLGSGIVINFHDCGPVDDSSDDSGDDNDDSTEEENDGSCNYDSGSDCSDADDDDDVDDNRMDQAALVREMEFKRIQM